MKKNAIMFIKNLFCIITIIWSVIMLLEYSIVLLSLKLEGFLYEMFDFFIIFLYIGIFAVPFLLLLSSILMAVIKEKYKIISAGKVLNIITVVLPVILAALMILTDFNSRLQ